MGRWWCWRGSPLVSAVAAEVCRMIGSGAHRHLFPTKSCAAGRCTAAEACRRTATRLLSRVHAAVAGESKPWWAAFVRKSCRSNTPIPSARAEFTTDPDVHTAMAIPFRAGGSRLWADCRSLARLSFQAFRPMTLRRAIRGQLWRFRPDRSFSRGGEERTTAWRTLEVKPSYGPQPRHMA